MTNIIMDENPRQTSIFKRKTIISMLQAALENAEYRFARQVALSWLAAFPGDMYVTLLQAQAVIADGKPAQVIPSLDLVCRKDPFYLDGYRMLAWASRDVDAARYRKARSSAYVLGDRFPEETEFEPWASMLRDAYLSLEARKYGDALFQVEEILTHFPDNLLAQALHVMIYRAVKAPDEVSKIAAKYYAEWSDCLPVSLALAEAYLELGNEPEAVRLLHLNAAGDTIGQVARRMWGDNHPYRSLWPDDLVILFDHPIPASVAGRFGWNRLSAGELKPALDEKRLPDQLPVDDHDQEEINQLSVPDPFTEVLEAFKQKKDEATSPGHEPPQENGKENLTAVDNAMDKLESDPDIKPEEAVVDPMRVESEPENENVNLSSHPEQAEVVKRKVEIELERLAKKLKQTGLSRSDGRYPVYVILSSRSGLEKQYGPQTASVIDGELRRLVGIMEERKGWQSMLFYPDHAACTSQCGLSPINASDPWKIKHSLSDLDTALGKRGEMIGALLIVGGDSVLPFHRLPNPAEDSDEEIASDSPYATLDANYFVPEWPVGRLPGENGSDAGALLEQIRQVQDFHNLRKKPTLWFGLEWLYWFKSFAERFMPNRTYPSFGYTAAVWRRSSLAVFRPIGAPHTVVASPPVYSGKLNPRRLTASNLGYYNLHGLEDSPSWYGQRDPMENGTSPDYPVAISPEDLHRNGRSPKFVFSEACYGGHVFGKSEKNSLALKFLSLGALGVVASTCISYGSINTPLIAADLLGHLFWQHMKGGHTVGEALMQAKVGLVREMNRRQGYLDGEDQKTIISFVLYGDPLASYDGFRVLNKSTHRYKDHPLVQTVVEENQEYLSPSKVPADVLKGIKQVVAEYLPGADVAGIQFCRLNMNGKMSEKEQPSGPISKNKKSTSGRMVVTVSKQVIDAHHIHRHFLRVTVDDAGQPLKVALSR